MNTLLAAIGVLLTAAVVLLAVRGARRSAPIRPWPEAARIAVGAAAIVLMAILTGVTVQPIVAIGAVVVGLVLGLLQGAAAEVRLQGDRLHWRRSLIAIAVWGAGVVLMQVAAILGLSGAFAFAQAVAYLALAASVGLMVGRRRPARRARTAFVVATVAAAVLLPALVAIGQETPPPTRVAVGPYPYTPGEAETVSVNEWRLEACGNGTFLVDGLIDTTTGSGRFVAATMGEGTWDTATGAGSAILVGTIGDGTTADEATSEVDITVTDAAITLTGDGEVVMWQVIAAETPQLCPEEAGTEETSATTTEAVGETSTTVAAEDTTTTTEAATTTEAPEVVVAAEDDDGADGGDDIDGDEALAAAVAGFLAAAAMGALSAAESEQTLGELIDEAISGPAESGPTATAKPAAAEPEVPPEAEPDTWQPPPGGVQVSAAEADDIVARGLAGGATADEMQRYLDGLNEARGGSGPVPMPPLPTLETVGLPDGRSVTATPGEVAEYREARATLEGTAGLDSMLQDAYRQAVAEKEKWVGLEQMPGLRWVAATQEILEELAVLDSQIADVEGSIADIAAGAPQMERQPGDLLYSHRMSEMYQRSAPEVPALLRQVSQLKAERLHRIQEMMGTQVGGEVKLPPGTTADETSMLHRPGMRIDEIDERMERIIDERKRIRTERDNAQRIVDAFEA